MARFVKVARVNEVPEGSARRIDVDGYRIALFHLDGAFYALDDMCSHAEASLAAGEIVGDCVVCPRHGARFSIKTGEARSLPAWAPVNTYEVRVDGDDVFIAL